MIYFRRSRKEYLSDLRTHFLVERSWNGTRGAEGVGVTHAGRVVEAQMKRFGTSMSLEAFLQLRQGWWILKTENRPYVSAGISVSRR